MDDEASAEPSWAGTEWHDDNVAVARFGLGTWSFVEFLRKREQHLGALKCRLREMEASEAADSRWSPSRRSSKTTTTYLGPGIADWPINGPRDITWLPTAPVLEYPFYPVVLDVLESAQALAPNTLITTAATALAPTWEELALHGLTDPTASTPRWDDVQGDDHDARESYLLGAVAHAVAALGPRFGVILRGAHRYDHASTVFVQRLLREAELTGFHIALESSVSLAVDPRYRDCLRQAHRINGRRRCKLASDISDRAGALLALSPQGLPARLLEGLAGSVPRSCGICDGPSCERWVFLTPSRYRILRRNLSSETRHDLHRRIFDSWDPTGWGYLRRGGHAIAAKDLARMQVQHTAYNYGLAEIGRDFLYRQFSELSNGSGEEPKDPQLALHAAVGAARLAPRVRRAGGLRAAARQYHRALHLTTDAVTQADLIYGIANLYARQRESDSLGQAAKWYERGNQLLDLIHQASDKAYMEIRFTNGLALVKYHQGRNDDALSLEQKALAIALSVKTTYPWLEAWARPIINANTAKLLEKRLGDFRGAMKLLESNISVQDKLHEEYARLELARLYFDQQEHYKVVELLSALYDRAHPTTLDEQQELFGRLMFSISLSINGDITRTRSQLSRLTYLLHVRGNSRLLSAIHCAVGETQQSH